MAIYNKNQVTVSQNHTNDFSRLSHKDDNMLSWEHKICQQPQIQESWLNIIGQTGHKPVIWSKLSRFHLNLKKNGVKFSFSTNLAFVHVVNLSHKLSR